MEQQVDLDRITLSRGAHSSRDDGVCIMELAAWLAGKPHSDSPACVSPILGAFLRNWNDNLDDEPRQRLKPYAARVLRTATTPDDEERRAWLATDWLVRVCAPAFLRAAKLDEHATALSALPVLDSLASAAAAQSAIDAAVKAADAAGNAAGAAARAAAWAAARAAARAAAWDAARAAAWDAARAAAWAALKPVVEELQESAFTLLDAMIAVGRDREVTA